MSLSKPRGAYAPNHVLAALFLIAGSLFALHAEESAPRARQFVRRTVNIGQSYYVGKPVATRAGGLVITPIFDSSITSAARGADIITGINAAIADYAANFSDSITVSIMFKNVSSGLGSSLTNVTNVTYVDYLKALKAQAFTADDATALASLPTQTANPVDGDTTMELTLPNARALGFRANPPAGQQDSEVDLATGAMNILPTDNDPSKYSLRSVAQHEIDEVLGMGSVLDNGANGPVRPEDLFRYDGSGNRSFTTSKSATSFFSINGKNNLAQFNQDKSGDFGDWFSANGNQVPQVQDAFGSPGTNERLDVELVVLDVIGYTRIAGGGGGGGPQAPVVLSAATCNPNPAPAGKSASFTVGVIDAANSALTITWDFGDSTKGSGASTVHTYTTEGTYTATATIINTSKLSVTSSVMVLVVKSVVQTSNLKQKFQLSFKTGIDGIDITMFNADFANITDGTSIQFVIGSGTVIDAGTFFRNKATGDTNFGKFTINTRQGTLRYVVTRATLQDVLAPYGAVAQPPSPTISIPMYFAVGSTYYGDTDDFFYTATGGRTGKGK